MTSRVNRSAMHRLVRIRARSGTHGKRLLSLAATATATATACERTCEEKGYIFGDVFGDLFPPLFNHREKICLYESSILAELRFDVHLAHLRAASRQMAGHERTCEKSGPKATQREKLGLAGTLIEFRAPSST